MSLSFLFPFELDSILLLTQDHSLPLLQGENLIFKNQFFFGRPDDPTGPHEYNICYF